MKNRNRPLLENKSPVKQIITTSRFLCLCLLLATANTGIAENTSPADKTVELESVRSQIADVKSDINSAKSESEQLQEELQNTEVEISRETLRLKEVEEEIHKRNDRLETLNQTIGEHEKALAIERSYLARQIRSAFMDGRSDYLKLLLNQEDPTKVGRVLAYYDYYNRARIDSINVIKNKVGIINDLSSMLIAETEQLEKLKDRQIARNEQLMAFRESRTDILERLDKDITEKDQQLKSLQEHEQKLFALINKLDKRDDKIIFFEDIAPFGTLRGKLQWPAQGRLLNKFGSSRKGASLKWQGVKIGASAGNEVQAVYTGKIIFADWFRNLGLLIIIDHGDGYMTLYGYNQTMLKKPGDWVLGGETIAYVGDTGGQTSSGVYFEIRHRGKPQNPELWCKR
jgi:septal ring factor EnvC (AmiA/AmiB activator)